MEILGEDGGNPVLPILLHEERTTDVSAAS